ncbi:MAG: PilZ domain-containing protein [Alphaproteobacteria bacterium]|nr:PilZ domain-containing protein [Alphaproteobacteria bacterium]MDP6819203.1 PilZ domain-containing protein [Alphaproteobacteria bacterium]
MSIRPVEAKLTQDFRRKHERVFDKKRQLRIKSGEREGRTSNWSEGGFLSNGLDDYHANDHIEGTMEGPGGAPVRFAGKVVRVQEDGMRAVQLVSLGSAALLTMQSTDSDDSAPDSSVSSRAYSSADKVSGGSNPDS